MFAVHFQPGGRTRPHVHGAGQLLHVVSGRGFVDTRDGRREVGPGDVVAGMPGEWHWRGATNDSTMRHVTVQRTATDPIDWDVYEGDRAAGTGSDRGRRRRRRAEGNGPEVGRTPGGAPCRTASPP